MRRQARFVLVQAVVILAVGCSGGGHRARVLEGTQPVGLPPVPADLLPDIHVVDVVLGGRCAEVPSGLRNCQDLPRREASRLLLQLLEEEVEARFEDHTQRQVEGAAAAGGFREDALFASEVTSTFAGHVQRRLEGRCWRRRRWRWRRGWRRSRSGGPTGIRTGSSPSPRRSAARRRVGLSSAP